MRLGNILWAVAALPLMAQGAAAAPLSAKPECEIAFSRMTQTVSWHQVRNRIKVDIENACAAHSTLPLQASGITVSVESGKKVAKRFRAERGIYIPALGTLQLRNVVGAPGTHGTLTIDLRSGEIRSADGFYLDLSQKSS